MIQEIKINIEDTKIFTPLAYILDQDKLLWEINSIRSLWFLDKQLIHYDSFDEWYKQPHYDFKLSPTVANYMEQGISDISDFSFTQVLPQNNLSDDKLKEIANLSPMDLELEHILRGNGLTARYKSTLLKAIVTGEVGIQEWEDIAKNSQFYHSDWWFDIPIFEKIYKGKEKPDIKRDRIWFWEDRRDIPQLQIAQETLYRPKWILPISYLENVKKGIQRYKLFLKSRET